MEHVTPEEYLRQILIEFEEDLRFLQTRNVLSKKDIQIIRNQAEISKDAMIRTRDESSIRLEARNKLLMALITNFEKNIQKTLDDVVSKKGDKELLILRLKKIDNKLLRLFDCGTITSEKLSKIHYGMGLLKSYILLSISNENRKMFKSRISVSRISQDYEKTIMDCIQNNSTSLKTNGKKNANFPIK